MKLVKIHSGQKEKKFRITNFTMSDRLKDNIHRVFNIDNNFLIYGFESQETFITLQDFPERAIDGRSYQLMLHGSEKESKTGNINFPKNSLSPLITITWRNHQPISACKAISG